MPRFVSILGKFHPAEEVVQLPLSHNDLLKGTNPIYRGPDRGALAMLVEQGYAVEDVNGPIFYNGDDDNFKGKRFKIQDLPGRSCLTEPDLIRQSRELGFKSVEEYLYTMHGISVKESEEKQKAILGEVINHEQMPQRKQDPIGPHAKSGPGPYKQGGFGDSSDPQSEAIIKGKK